MENTSTDPMLVDSDDITFVTHVDTTSEKITSAPSSIQTISNDPVSDPLPVSTHHVVTKLPTTTSTDSSDIVNPSSMRDSTVDDIPSYSDMETDSNEETESESDNDDTLDHLGCSSDENYVDDDGITNKQSFTKTSLAELQRHHCWLYYDAINEGYKCKICELFPEGVVGSRGRNKKKFSEEVVKDLTDHPKRVLTRHERSKKHDYAVKQYEEFKSRQTIATLEKKKEAKAIHTTEVTEQALEKLMKITVFMVKKHWAHVNNYEDFVNFVGNELQDLVLNEYLKLCNDRKNATYLSEFTVMKFLTIIGEYMENEALQKVRDSEQFTIMLDESTDEANRSELAVIARVVDENGNVENHFLKLIQLSRCDALTIFTAVYDYLVKNDIDFSRVRFSGMDGCSTMLGEHKGVTVHFKENSSHHSSIHCRNHRLALCFAHLIPFHKQFETFDGLLLNLYLLLKNSTVKSSIFQEVQNSYNLTSLKLIKAAVTRWLSHGKASQRVLDRYPQLVEALSKIYERKKEPAVQGLLQQLTHPETGATLCFLSDVIDSTNSLQVFLQHAHLNFLELPSKVDSLIKVLELIQEDPCRPDSNFEKLDKFLEVASKTEQLHCTRSSSITFSKDRFIRDVTKPFLSDLIQEIKTAFEIPEHLKGFTVFDPQKLPLTRDELDTFGDDLIELLCQFYGQPYKISVRGEEYLPKLIDGAALKSEFKVFKVFSFKERFRYEMKQREELDRALSRKEKSEKKLATMADLLSTRKQIAERKRVKELEEEIGELRKAQKSIFKSCTSNGLRVDWDQSILSFQKCWNAQH